MKPMLAHTYSGQNVDGWLMSEKLDGVRAIWTGAELLSRNGNPFYAPEWFRAALPVGVALDGELYLGRGSFQSTVGAVRRKTPIDAEWRNIQYRVFDAHEYPGGFESRIAYCAYILSGCSNATVIQHTVCKNMAHLNEYYTGLVNHGAEGVMLRRPGSRYEHRRSSYLMKLKPSSSDEAVVIGHSSGAGHNLGRLGALICQWKNVIFNLGTGMSESIRDNPPRIGSKVSFMFQGLTDGGVPRFPVFVAERNYE